MKANKHSKTNKEVNTEFLYQAVELQTSDCSIFTENEGLVQIKFIITIHDFGPDYTLHYPKLHGSPPSESPFTIFEQLALALEKQSCPEISHCIEYTFYIEDF